MSGLLLRELFVALVLGRLGLVNQVGNHQDFAFVLFCSVDAVLELVRSHVPALLGETAGFQVQTDFLSALRECLYLLAPDEQLTFVLDNIEASSNSSRGLFENRVALRAPAGQQKIGKDDHDGRCGNHDQLHLLFHRSPPSSAFAAG